jgi:secreted PhoX family phosphatase
MISRRQFNQGIVTLAFAGFSRYLVASPSHNIHDKTPKAYGKLLNDPAGLLDLLAEFSYRVISSLNDKMTDGLSVPNRADGMGYFYINSERVTLIRNHEAACVDPRTGIVYMTEDRNNSLLYRFIPHEKSNLHAGGQLQTLVVNHSPKLDTRNWNKISIQKNQSMAVNWIDLEEPQSPKDDLRLRGFSAGAALCSIDT